MPLRNSLILLLTCVVCVACAMQARLLRYGGKVGQAMHIIEDYYIKEVDPQDLYVSAMQGMVSKLDAFSDFIPPQRYEEFQSTIEQRFGGIGINIEGPPVVDRLTVIAPIPGTPAYLAGIQAGDVILEIDGQSTQGVDADQAIKLMRGVIGSAVTLTVQRMDSAEVATLTLERADIEIRNVFGDHILEDSNWDYFLREDPRIAYIRITMFGERTVQEFQQALEAIRDRAQAVIIDLRYNPGGVLPAAVEICDMLVDQGTLLRTQGRREVFDSEFLATSNLQLSKDIPMVLLINGDSASASEIMAGCLQDLGRAKIAGTRSFGKGTVQQVFPLENGSAALKFTTARFLRPSGKNIHREEKMTEDDVWGVAPDPQLDVPMTDVEQIYLNRRWNLRSDPRLVVRGGRPPEPPFAADPQLAVAVAELWKTIGQNATGPAAQQPTVEDSKL